MTVSLLMHKAACCRESSEDKQYRMINCGLTQIPQKPQKDDEVRDVKGRTFLRNEKLIIEKLQR